MNRSKYYADNQRHLVCIPYGIEELHAMARDLEIPRSWFHATPYPHYDIPVRDIPRIQAHEAVTLVRPREVLMICKTGAYIDG